MHCAQINIIVRFFSNRIGHQNNQLNCLLRGTQNEFWLGLELIYQLTIQPGQPFKLRIETLFWESSEWYWRSSEWSYFSIENEANQYKLHVWGFSGDQADGIEDIGG